MNFKVVTLSRYAIFGLIFNVLGYLIYSALTYSESLNSEKERFVVSALLLFPFVFIVNRRIVFQSRNKLLKDLSRYIFIYFMAIIYGLTGLSISLLVFTNPYIAQAVSSIVVLAASFAINNFWSFRQISRD